MDDPQRERREAWIAANNGKGLPYPRKKWCPTMGEPNDVDAEALVAAVAAVECIPASRYRPDTKRDFLFIRGAIDEILANAPAPPKRLAPSRDLDLDERMALVEAGYERTQAYVEALYKWCRGNLATCLMEHIAHLEQQRLIDMLNTPWESEIKFYAREVDQEHEHERFKLTTDCVAALDVLCRMAEELGINLRDRFGIEIERIREAMIARVGAALPVENPPND
jgi:hypothetical protein